MFGPYLGSARAAASKAPIVMQARAETTKLGFFAAIEGACPSCGGGTSVLARACPHCGAPLRMRATGLAVAGALALLLAAVVVALLVTARGYQLAAATSTGAPADRLVAASTGDFDWLRAGLNNCDMNAKANPSALHFLVTPLAAADTAAWRAKSINDSGSGILLLTGAMFDGLKSGDLRVYPADYAFSIADEATGQPYRWRPASGPAEFSAADVAAIGTFRVKFRTAHAADAEYGTSFRRQDGTCYWVNVVLGG